MGQTYRTLEQTEKVLNRRAYYKAESVEDAVLRSIEYEQLHRAIYELPETQKRRFILCYFQGLTADRRKGRVSHPAVIKSVSTAIEKIKKIFQNRVTIFPLCENEVKETKTL